MTIAYQEGWIEVITGCMFAGKTEEFIRRIGRLQYAKQEILIFKPDIDKRYNLNAIVSHSGKELTAIVVEHNDPQKIITIVTEMKKNQQDKTKKIVIAIDEIQFFTLKIVKVIEHLANNYRVIVSGLDNDFRGQPFPVMCELLPRAEFITKLSAVCLKCGRAATKTQKLHNGQPARIDEPTIDVGADDKYEARCRQHHELIKP